MDRSSSTLGVYLMAALLGVAVGAVGVVAISRAIPSMMSRMMVEMMTQMGGEGCDPEQM